MNKLVLGLLPFALLACGDNRAPTLTPDSSEPDSAMPDSPPDTPAPFVVPTPFAIPLSAAGPDQLQSAAPAPGGGFYAAGFAAATTTSGRFIIVLKLLPTGALDPTFGTAGVGTTAVEFAGGSDDIDVTVQADGKVLVSATTKSPTITGDRDIAVIRLASDGTLDAGFGDGGVAIINLADAIMNGTTPTAPDASRGLEVSSTGEIFLHAASRGLGKKSADNTADRTDTDYTVVKLTSSGAVDTAFGGQSITLGQGFSHTADTAPGQFRLDIQETSATPRALHLLADGKLMVSGYGNTPSSSNTTQPVLYKLTAAGTLDTTWGTAQGVFHEQVLPIQTEVYNIAIHGNGTFTTAGYGRATGELNDYISLRFKLDAAANEDVRDLTYNNTTNGALVFDPSGAMLGSNCRNALALPGNKTMLMGSTGPSNMPAQDAVVAFVDDAGQLDTGFGDGVHVFKLGNDGNDQFWGAARSGNKVLVVGYQGGGAANAQTETSNDDAFAVIFDLP